MLRKDLRGDLDAILGKALSRRPQDRYETAASFADDLERFCSGRPVRAHRRSGWYATRKFIRRNQIAVSASCATVVTLAAATAIALSQAREAAHQARLAANERDRALAAAAHREAVDDFMSDLLLEAGRTGKPVSVSALIARADALSDREFANDPEARAAVLRTVGTFELEFDGPDRALDSFDKAQKILENTLDSGLRASVSCDRALLRGVMGNVDEAERTLAQTALDPQTPEDVRSECDGNQAQLAIFRGDGVGAIKAAERAIAEWEASARRSPTRHLELLTYRAEAQKLNGEPGKADADFVHVLDELGKLGRERGPFGYTVRNYRIGIAMETGNPRLALSLIDESISMVAHDISDRSLPLMTLYQRSREIDELGRHEEALRGYRHVAEASRSKNDVLGQRAMLDAAAALSKLGRHREAERLFDSAVPANGRLPPGQSRVGGLELAWRMTRAKLDLDVRAFSEARASVGKAMALPGLQPSSVATLLQIRAQANLGIGEFDKALQDAQAALDLNQKQRGDQPCSLRVGQSQIVLGQSLQAVGKLAEAQRAYSVALEQIIPCAGGEHPDGIRAKALLERISHKKLGASST
jgi:tetratricopeptide (TPR) repeat protein